MLHIKTNITYVIFFDLAIEINLPGLTFIDDLGNLQTSKLSHRTLHRLALYSINTHFDASTTNSF